jgi:hypothetical protein
MKIGIVAFAVLAILVVTMEPTAFASTLTVNLDPNSKVATLTSVSTTDMVLTYPANSTLSSYLKGYNSSVAWSGNFNSSSEGLRSFQGHFEDQANDRASVQNMTVTFRYNAKANATSLVVSKETDITAGVTGVFKISNGTVAADLGWRSFYIIGALDLNLEGHVVDVNQVGSSLTQSVSGRGLGVAMLKGMFAGNGIWDRPTLNFSSLSSPLSTWTRNYDYVANTTTYSKTISGQSTLSANYTSDGSDYALSVTSDPSAAISTHGYAVVSGNSLLISKAPFYLNPFPWAATALVIITVGVAILVRRARSSGAKLAASSPPGPG